MAPKKKPNPRSQYFQAIKDQKMESLRWCLRHGGITLRAEDDDGHTGIQLAAAGGYTTVLEAMLEMVGKGLGTQEDVDMEDEDGRTPLMMAAFNGKFEAVRLLVKQGKAKLDKVRHLDIHDASAASLFERPVTKEASRPDR